MSLNYQVSSELLNINENKRKIYEENIIKKCEKCSVEGKASCQKCVLSTKLLFRYYNANISVDYWSRNIDGFKGDEQLVKLYNLLTKDITKTYESGISYLLKGSHGNGKTYIASLLIKKFVEKGYSGLYTTLSEIVNVLLHSDFKAKITADKCLKICDILVIDEFDTRHMGNSENAGMLFGKLLESILRIRLQNKMPTILITNNPDPTKALGDALGASITSLISGYVKEINVIGRDFRKIK